MNRLELEGLSEVINRIQEIKSRFGEVSPLTYSDNSFDKILAEQMAGSGTEGSVTGASGVNMVSNVPYDSLINSISMKYGMDPALVAAVIKAESDFSPQSVSKAGAMGLMQLMPENVKDYGVGNPFDPAQNIDGGVRHLKDMIDKFNGDLRLGLAAYNAGPNAVLKYGGIPPYAETQAYVPKVLNYYEEFKSQSMSSSASITRSPGASSQLGGDGSGVVSDAMKYLGIPYEWGGDSPQGFDCSGLTKYVYRDFGVTLPHSAEEQSRIGISVSRDQLISGDLIFFAKNGRVHHVGIYIGNDRFLHAPNTGDVVKISNLSGTHYGREFTIGRRYL